MVKQAIDGQKRSNFVKQCPTPMFNCTSPCRCFCLPPRQAHRYPFCCCLLCASHFSKTAKNGPLPPIPCSHQGEASNKQTHDSVPTAHEIYILGKDIQNHFPDDSLSVKATEDRRFREYFGCAAATTLLAWNMLISFEFLPKSAMMTLQNHICLLF